MVDVAFCRTLKSGMVGNDVVAHKRAVGRYAPDLYPWAEFTPFYGPVFEKAVAAVQKRRNVHADPAGVIGQATHHTLELAANKNGEPAFDAYAVKMAADFCETYVDDRVRDAIVAAGFYWYSHRAQIAYSQHRPFQLGKPPWIPARLDCSGFVTVCHYAAGAPNPNGRPWDGLGYTGTLMTQGHRVLNVAGLEPGDLIFYGFSSGAGSAFRRGDPTHVALYVGKRDGTHMVLSMGSHPMRYVPYNYRADINHYRAYDVSPEV